MVNLLFMIGLVLLAVVIVGGSRRRRDHSDLAARVRELGGELLQAERARKKEHPFPDSGRGWWPWKVLWRDARGQRLSWALTTREGIKDWRD